MTDQSLEPISSKDNSQSVSPRKESSLSEAVKQSKYTDENVGVLEKAFEDGASITEACRIAQIHRDTYYEWLKVYPEFSDKMKNAQDYPDVVAKMVVVRAMKNNDVDTAKWWNEHHVRDEFYKKQKNDTNLGGEVNLKGMLQIQIDAETKTIQVADDSST